MSKRRVLNDNRKNSSNKKNINTNSKTNRKGNITKKSRNSNNKKKYKSEPNRKTSSNKKRINKNHKHKVKGIKRTNQNIKSRKIHQRVNKEKFRKDIDKRVKIISNNITGFKVPIFVYFIIGYIFFVMFITLTLFSKIETINNDILKMHDEKQVLMEEKRYLEITLNAGYNINNIKEVAEKELNMKTPEEHQIIYIEIPKESSVNYSSNNKKSEESILKKFIN